MGPVGSRLWHDLRANRQIVRSYSKRDWRGSLGLLKPYALIDEGDSRVIGLRFLAGLSIGETA